MTGSAGAGASAATSTVGSTDTVGSVGCSAGVDSDILTYTVKIHFLRINLSAATLKFKIY